MMNPLKLIKENDPEANIQKAVEIELSTIPIYLYTYYSINRTPNQNKIIADLTNWFIDSGEYSPEAAAARAQNISVDIMVHANKAGATIMSVAVEEMLHMSLASNLKRALVGMPKLTGLSPSFPAQLPGHKPGFEISLTGYSLAQLNTFQTIEQPEQGAHPHPEKTWDTIGEFYGWILEYIDALPATAFDRFRGQPQLGPNKGYYATNNVNTMYYDRNHQQQYANEDNQETENHKNHEGKTDHKKDDLLIIDSKETARRAIEIIVTQGEGHHAPKADGQQLKFRSPVVPEESHYQKFCNLYAELDQLSSEIGGVDLTNYFVKPVPKNPTTASYPAHVQTVSNLLNAVYTYLYMMTEACYRHNLPKQAEIFNFGMHKGMIFILSTLCDAITSLPLPGGGVAAPTFENYTFSPATSAKLQLIALYNQIPAHLNPNPNVLQRIGTLPDMDIVSKEMLSFA